MDFTFEGFNLSKQLLAAINELGFSSPTPIQKESFPVILSGRDMLGISQTGTGKTLAYMMPLLQNLKFSKQIAPRVLVLVPTRELVLQIAEMAESMAKYLNLRVLGVYGGKNIAKQKLAVLQGIDILVATPGRLYDLAVCNVLQLKSVKKLVIDEVDVMLDLGFRFQLTNIFEMLPKKRQNIMFSATMTTEVDLLIEDYFMSPVKISIAVSGAPLVNIEQESYAVQNFNTKINLLSFLLQDNIEYNKVLVFVSTKKMADRLFEALQERYGQELCIIHSNKTQNYRERSIRQFNEGENRIIVATDIMARGLDLEKVTHVISFDVPEYPENYIHRIGRTGRAGQQGKSILFYTQAERESKESIESFMGQEIPQIAFPSGKVTVSGELIPEERPRQPGLKIPQRSKKDAPTGAFHEKKEKNKKTNQGGSYLRKMKVYKKPKTRGDKNINKRNKKK